MAENDIHSDDTNAANYGGVGACAKTSKSSVQAFKKMKKDLNKCGGFSRFNEDSLSQCLDAHRFRRIGQGTTITCPCGKTRFRIFGIVR